MQMKRQPPKNIIIVGGGTAGWMAANWLAHYWRNQECKITLIESPEVGIIGVGEGSTPYLRNFFRNLGIAENEWMPACNATYKAGISFPDWVDHPNNRNYFHPFFTYLDIQSGERFFYNACQRRRGLDVPAHPNDFFVTAALARARLAPVPRHKLDYEPDYAYHFDSGLLGLFLSQRARMAGVNHISDTVTSVELTESGEIGSLYLHSQGRLHGDFYIDCTGFSGVLINRALREPFISFANNLFNDCAVAMPTPMDNGQDIPVETISCAMKYGWSWKIPLTNRYGNGYVYSSSFASQEQAEKELREHLGDSAKGQEARHLKMRIGRIERHWSKNCLALGLSQGFIEPLEATALMLVQFTIEMFCAVHDSADTLVTARQTLNQKINMMFDGVRDYIVAHYQLNSRTDTDYWVENREHTNISSNLAEIFHSWDSGADFEATLTKLKATQVYLRPSWYCLLAGMGRFPGQLQPPTNPMLIQAAPASRTYCAAIAKKLVYGHQAHLQELYGDSWRR